MQIMMEKPKETTTSTSTPKKPRSKPPIVLVHEETPGSSTSELSLSPFARDYITPRTDTKNPSHFSEDPKYELVETKIPAGMIVA